MTAPTLGSILRDAREAKKWTQFEAAVQTGISTATICRYERDEVAVSVPNLAALCRAYGLDIGSTIRDAGIHR